MELKTKLFAQRVICILLIVLFTLSLSYAQDSESKSSPEQEWALGLAMRRATIVFATDEDRSVVSAVPLMFYRGKYFYMRGIEGGFRFHQTGDWRFSALGRLYFFDIPKQYQNEVQGDNVHWGLQARYQPFELPFLDMEILSDLKGNVSGNARLGLQILTGGFEIDPFFEAKWKSNRYNSYYYGLTIEDVNAGMEMSLGIVADYHLISNFYFFAAAKATLLEKNVRDLSFINRDIHAQAFLGFGFSNDRSRPMKDALEIGPYLRLAHGWGTPTDLKKVIIFQAERDSNNTQISSLFYGFPLTDEVFTLPIHLYITTGLAWHWAIVKPSIQEIVLAIKAFYTIPLPVRFRIGAAEGFSYVTDIPDMENREMERKGYKPSNLMNFLDFSFDLNIGDIFGGQELKKWWLGYSVHHRSSIFESAQQFGRINGGSNFQTICLQWHFK